MNTEKKEMVGTLETVAQKWGAKKVDFPGTLYVFPGTRETNFSSSENEPFGTLWETEYRVLLSCGRLHVSGVCREYTQAESRDTWEFAGEYLLDEGPAKLLLDLGIDTSLKCRLEAEEVEYCEVDTIDLKVQKGGDLCPHTTNRGSDHCFWSDAPDRQVVSPGKFCQEHPNQYHVGCMEAPEVIKVTGGTFVIEGVRYKTQNGGIRRQMLRVTATPDADKTELWVRIQNILAHR